MKKLIVVVATAVLGFASFGSACSVEPVKETAWVYKWTFKGKTTTGEKAPKVNIAASACYAPLEDVECAVRVPTSLKIEGYMAICSPGCGTETFEACSEENEVFWQKKPFKASLAGGVVSDIVHIIGTKKNKVELAGQANFDKYVDGTVQEGTYTFTYAGFGSYDTKKGRIKNVKGTFAGYLSQPHAVSVDLCTSAGYWDCSTLGLMCEAPSPVTGTFKVRYSKSASKKYLKGVTPPTPSWYVAPQN